MKKAALIIFLFILSLISFSQDIQFSHINQTKLYLNPAFAGAENLPGAVLGHRNFSPSEFGDYISYHASYQQYVDVLEGGIGFQLINDRQSNGAISRIYSSGIYAYQFQVENNIIVQAGLEARYAHLSIRNKEFTFPNMFDPADWQVSGSGEYIPENLNNTRGSYLEFNAGAIMTYKNFMIRKYREFTVGLSVHHLNKPNTLLTHKDKRIKRRYNFYFDIIIPLVNQRSKGFIPLLTPVLLIEKQGSNMNFSYGSYLSLSDFQMGNRQFRRIPAKMV